MAWNAKPFQDKVCRINILDLVFRWMVLLCLFLWCLLPEPQSTTAVYMTLRVVESVSILYVNGSSSCWNVTDQCIHALTIIVFHVNTYHTDFLLIYSQNMEFRFNVVHNIFDKEYSLMWQLFTKFQITNNFNRYSSLYLTIFQNNFECLYAVFGQVPNLQSGF